MSQPGRSTPSEGEKSGKLTWQRSLPRGWRRSLQTRVVVVSVIASALVVGTVGWLVYNQIYAGVLNSRIEQVVAEGRSETQLARERLQAADGTEFDPASQLRQLSEAMVARGDVRGFGVVLTGPLTEASTSELATDATDRQLPSSTSPTSVRTTPGLLASSVPTSLAAHVDQETSSAWTFGTAFFDAETEEIAPYQSAAIVFGSKITLPADGSQYGLYYVFTMEEANATLALVQRSLLIGGALLLLLLAGSVFLVTRGVVVPVRTMREVAERIASGQLGERMSVRGEDDIARLSKSFNLMADALQAQIRQLVELSQAQRQFVSDVSHELRTPLTTIRMASDVLFDHRDSFEPTSARSVELLQTQLDRFENLLADLLEISRFDAGAARLEISTANVIDLVHRVVEEHYLLASEQGVEIQVVAPTPAIAEVDVRRIERILRNLLGNAIDYADPSHRPGIVIEVATSTDAVAVTVRDFGPGLTPEQQRSVFSRFWRADPARARTTGGTGLGLPISLEDAQLHGGWLHVWSQPGQGTQFRLTLPRLAGERMGSSPLPVVPASAEPAATAVAGLSAASKQWGLGEVMGADDPSDPAADTDTGT